MHPFNLSNLRAEVLGVPEEDFHTAVDLGDTYPPTVFLDMLRDSSECCSRWGKLCRFGLPNSWLPDSWLACSAAFDWRTTAGQQPCKQPQADCLAWSVPQR